MLKAGASAIAVGAVAGSGRSFAAVPAASSVAPGLTAEVFPFPASTDALYPEQSMARYSAAAGKLGVAFSGGGPRAFSAALGQMRGLHAAGLLPEIGAISCVSGGTWFGSLFTFVPDSVSDQVLLGAPVRPENITVESLEVLPANYLGTTLNGLSNLNLGVSLAAQFTYAYETLITFDRIYSRVLNDLLLSPYGLGDTDTYFTLDTATAARIQQVNDIKLQTARRGRPFFIAGSTQIDQPNRKTTVARQVGLPGQTYYSFEYTSLYTGISQFSVLPGAHGTGSADFGGGYVESFAFDTHAPTAATAGAQAATVTVKPGKLPFLLSDAMGSSSAALGAYVQEYVGPVGPYEMAAFDYWPVRDLGTQKAVRYAFGDGGILENTGVVALLRRGYRTIFAFVNSPFPLGSGDSGCVDGIDGQITRLFGHVPKDNYGTPQVTQIFHKSLFPALAAGLKAARAAGSAPIYVSTFPILDDNPFGLAPYAPQIVWFYNDLNEDWRNRLSADVQLVLRSTEASNYMLNFPNYDTVVQNVDTVFDVDDPQVLLLTARQINLLAHMWSFTVTEALKVPGEVAGVPIAAEIGRG